MKNKIIYVFSTIAIVAGVYLMLMSKQELSDVESTNTPEPSGTINPSLTPELTGTSSTRGPQQTGNVGTGTVPLPTGDGRTTFVDEPVPWNLLLGQASCGLQGEVKFLNHNTYDNQDARFIYGGIDHPARNISWTVTPQDDISVGPNIFSKLKLPNGESLLGVTLPENPKHKQYELTAKIQYGRLVDAKGNFVAVGGDVKVFEKQCAGKTIIVLP